MTIIFLDIAIRETSNEIARLAIIDSKEFMQAACLEA